MENIYPCFRLGFGCVVLAEQDLVVDTHHMLGQLGLVALKWKFLSCSHCQELGQLADLASDWLLTLVQPISSQLADLASD